MKRYFDKEDFITFLKEIEENKQTKLFQESLEDSSIEGLTFMKMEFNSCTIILYTHPSGDVGIIQDTPVAPWEDYAEIVFGDLTLDGEFKIFIK